jgi:hypothetical protein
MEVDMSASLLRRQPQDRPDERRPVDPRIIKEAGLHIGRRIDEFTSRMAREVGEKVKEMNSKP